jgi:hypothetical protein
MLSLNLPPGLTTTRRRDLTLPAGFISPCLPMMAPRPPSGPLWLHEIKHDGLRIIARKDSRRVTLYDQQGNDLTQRFPLIVGAMAELRSCTIDGEAVTCDDGGIPSFDLLRRHQTAERAFLYVFDLIEIASDDRRRDPLEQRKTTTYLLMLRLVWRSTTGSMATNSTVRPYLGRYVRSASKASCQSAKTRAISRDDHRTGSRRRIRPARRCGGRASTRRRNGRYLRRKVPFTL